MRETTSRPGAFREIVSRWPAENAINHSNRIKYKIRCHGDDDGGDARCVPPLFYLFARSCKFRGINVFFARDPGWRVDPRPELLLSPRLNGGFAREPNGSNKPLPKPSYHSSRLLTRPVDRLIRYIFRSFEIVKSVDCWEIGLYGI